MPSLVEDYLADLPYLVRGAGIPVRDYEVVGPERTPYNPLGVYMLTPDNVRERTPEEMEELRLDAEATRAARFREIYAMIGLQVAVHPSGALDISLGANVGSGSERGLRNEGSYAVGQIKLTIHHLYADMMNLYGDRGNVIAIKKRAGWRGIPVDVVDVGLGENIRPTSSADLFLFGGGQDREQALLAEDLSGTKGVDLRAIVEDGGVVLGVCGGYQLMGHYYETPDGEKLPGVGIFDMHTRPRREDEARLIGNVLARVRAPEDEDVVREIVGFENHGGRTELSETEPLAEIVVGYGNNGRDDTEGARRLNAYGTYLHGSLLPKNPWLTDQLLLNALRRVDEKIELEPLDDAAELSAFSSVAELISGRGRG